MSIVESVGHQSGQRGLNGVSAGAEVAAPSLHSAVSVAELSRRPSRPPDYAAENRALIALAAQLATSPAGILQTLADTALRLCGAQTAGVSLLDVGGQEFYWPAIAGQWAEHVGGGTPRGYGPCGTVLDRDAPLLFSHPERDFDYLQPITPQVEEALLMPFYIDGKAVGTIWVVTHDSSRRFETEDLRLMTNLGSFAASAYQTLSALEAMRKITSVVESSDDAIVTKDLNGTITSWNGGAEQIFGYSAAEAVGKPISMLIPVEYPDEEPTILDRIRLGERIDHYETVRIRKDGRAINISLTVSPIKDVGGKIIGASKIARDITERKRTEAQISILAREAEHRTKNVLATVQATVHLTQAETTAGLKAAIEGRIHVLANVHTLFVESRWAGAELRGLVTQELAPYRQRDGERVRIDGEDQMLEPNKAQTIAVTIHELATNAAKYGALSAADGRVHVAWSIAGGNLVLRWSETGGPPVRVPTHQGFGTRVIAGMIRQNGGEIGFDWRSQGLVCEIAVPV